MKFVRYSSIENSYREKFIDKVVYEGHSDGEWSVTEKIHGSNFAFYVQEGLNKSIEIRCAKRSGFIDDGENFFNYQVVLERYRDAITSLFNDNRQGLDGPIVSMSIHGELFGGHYPHKDINKSQYKAIQKGVFYSNNVEFVAFDVKINTILQNTKVLEKLEEYGIPTLKPIYRGTMDECLAYRNSFQTTIPAILGLPEIENNICEGVVIKPNNPRFLYDRTRVIIKNKNEKFKEIQQESKHKNRTPKKEVELTEDAAILKTKIPTYCNENRLNNLISKMGELKPSDFGKIMKELNQDAIEDFVKDTEKVFNRLDKKEQKILTKLFGSYNSSIIKAYFRGNV